MPKKKPHPGRPPAEHVLALASLSQKKQPMSKREQQQKRRMRRQGQQRVQQAYENRPPGVPEEAWPTPLTDKPKGSRLPDEIKRYIVSCNACYRPPSVVAKSVSEFFGVTVTRQQVELYDPTKSLGRSLSLKWKEHFARTRVQYLAEMDDIGLAHATVRLHALDRMCQSAEDKGNYALAAQLIEQAAQEVTTRRTASGQDCTTKRLMLANMLGVSPDRIPEHPVD
jgi:hypothetical protein